MTDLDPLHHLLYAAQAIEQAEETFWRQDSDPDAARFLLATAHAHAALASALVTHRRTCAADADTRPEEEKLSEQRPTEPSPEQRAANLAEQSTWPAPDTATHRDTHRKAEG